MKQKHYKVKEVYRTIQGEGGQTGRTAVFVRFSGCNLWNGREKDRATAVCQFCDTDFVGTDGPQGGTYTADQLIDVIHTQWANPDARPFIVMTGGEPLLQLDQALVDALNAAGIETAVETNGTIDAPNGIDWICVSPKANSTIVQRSGQELKIVYPQPEVDPATFANWSFERFSIQPMDGPEIENNIQAAMQYCLAHPQWKLSLQTHKLLGIP